MKKTNTFKWVPMLLKAYVDAQTQMEQKKTRESARPAGDQEGAPELPAAFANGNGGTTGPVRPQRQPAQRRKARQQAASYAGSLNYQWLYKELRETKERLNHLEDIRQQIEEMQSKFDHHLAELAKKLESPSSDDEKNN